MDGQGLLAEDHLGVFLSETADLLFLTLRAFFVRAAFHAGYRRI